jgi:hypothetical protein
MPPAPERWHRLSSLCSKTPLLIVVVIKPSAAPPGAKLRHGYFLFWPSSPFGLYSERKFSSPLPGIFGPRTVHPLYGRANRAFIPRCGQGAILGSRRRKPAPAQKGCLCHIHPLSANSSLVPKSSLGMLLSDPALLGPQPQARGLPGQLPRFSVHRPRNLAEQQRYSSGTGPYFAEQAAKQCGT